MPLLTRLHAAAAMVLVAGVANSASAQSGGFDATYGRWWADSAGPVMSASVFRRLTGLIGYGAGVAHFQDHAVFQNRTNTGGELSLSLGRDGSGVYLVGAAGLGMRHRDGNIDGQWSAGLGLALRPLSFLSLGIEARYRVEDQALRGFWRLDPSDRRGVVLLGRLAFGSGSRGGLVAAREPDRPRFEPPSREGIVETAREGGMSTPGAEIAGRVVRTALDAMGTPYTWGGTDENGFDCSGLIQYAYGQHGLVLPRVSRDQLRLGTTVEPKLESLQPGDLLGFAVEGDRVTHIGLYVGEGRFIHSASGGVTTTALDGADPDSQWWQRRWIVARRLLR